jgi:hypothetical protein
MKTVAMLIECLLLAAILACSNSKEPTQAQASTPAPVTAGTVAPPAATPAAPAPAPSRAIATGEGTLPGTHVEVLELKRSSGGTVTLRFAIVNGSSKTLDMSAVLPLLDLSGGYTVANAHLIDPVGRKKYFTARDSEGKCVCSTYAFINQGARANHWAKFPAPPDEVERLSVVIPPFAPMDDVPLTR